MRQTENTQKKDNRKSIFVIALLLLLVAVIGFGGYTLSKYVTKKSESGSASVAKWGYTVETDASKLFGTKYTFEDTNSVVTDANAKLTVAASDAKTNKVAPGTTGSMTFKVKGQAEVLAQIKIEMTDVKDVKLTYTKDAGEQVYAPVKWTLKKNGEVFKSLENVTLAEIKAGLDSTVVVEANTTAIDDTYTLEWAWAFTTGDDNDNLDTLLGMVANAGDHAEAVKNGDYTEVIGADMTNTTISFKLEISIVQLQEHA